MIRDFSKLSGRIVEKYGTRAAFGVAMNLNPEQLSRRLNNRTQFSADEMMLALDLLDIPPEEIHTYFFTPKVR